jgi:hypothetical protein
LNYLSLTFRKREFDLSQKLTARRFPPPLAYFRLRRSMNFAKAIPPKTNMHSDTKITMRFVTVGRFSGTCMATLSAAANSVP